MKVYSILTKMSTRKNGAFLPIPKQKDKNQLYFDFYKIMDSSIEKKENVAENGVKKHNMGKCGKAHK